jgi:hypothetical protein
MANDFKNWTPEMVKAHNIRIISRRKKPHGNDQNNPAPSQPDQPQSDPKLKSLGKVAKTQSGAEGLHRSAAKVGHGGQGDGALPELKTLGRTAILITDYRIRLIDEDNASPKQAVDNLRYARFIPDDRPEDVKLFVRQKKVTTPADIRTEIELSPIADNWDQDALFRLPALIVRLLANDYTALEELAEMLPVCDDSEPHNEFESGHENGLVKCKQALLTQIEELKR